GIRDRNVTGVQTCALPISVSEIVLGVKCGGSDGFSGISANPSLGRAADLLVRSGGTILITEVPEFCGAEHILANRAKDAETGRRSEERRVGRECRVRRRVG